MLVNLTFLLVFAPALPTQPPLKSILKRKREVLISSDDNDNKSDLDDGEEDLPGDGDYRQGNRQSKWGGRGGGVIGGNSNQQRQSNITRRI
jgi:hypothetical protein